VWSAFLTATGSSPRSAARRPAGWLYAARMTDRLSTLYQDLLSGRYEIAWLARPQRIFPDGHDLGGFRVWWRALTGSDETLENAYLMRMAGRFSLRTRVYACLRAGAPRTAIFRLPGWRGLSNFPRHPAVGP
jgi:hypothetical protein